MKKTRVHYINADEAWKQRIAEEWSETVARHIHLTDGFSILALGNGKLVGLISVYWRALPVPLSGVFEGYIDIIEVLTEFRRQGIATAMIEMAAEHARQQSVYQLRAWNSEDKVEAVTMWKALGFGLCPVTTYPKGQEVRGYFATKVL